MEALPLPLMSTRGRFRVSRKAKLNLRSTPGQRQMTTRGRDHASVHFTAYISLLLPCLAGASQGQFLLGLPRLGALLRLSLLSGHNWHLARGCGQGSRDVSSLSQAAQPHRGDVTFPPCQMHSLSETLGLEPPY